MTSIDSLPDGLSARILVFDSGVGGLTILQEIEQQFPQCTLFYSSDNAAFPYGGKSATELVERVDQVLQQLQQVTQADIIIVACNTASTVALPRIRQRFSQAIIGVVPAIKPAAQLSQTKVIGLLATVGTIKRDYTQQLITEFAQHCTVIPVGSSELVQLAEEKLRGRTITTQHLATIVAPFTAYPTMDTLVLACTHFPLLKQELQEALPNINHWVDSGAAIGRRVGYWLQRLQLATHSQQNVPQVTTAYFTEQSQASASLEKTLAQWGIERIEYL